MRRSETRRGSQIAEKGQRAFRDAECNYRRTTRFCRLVAAAILGILIVSRLYVAVAADVLTQHYNNGRTGATLDESILNTTNVSSGKFEKLWTLYADGQVVAQPLYVSNLSIDTTANRGAPVVKGKFNTVIIATMHNTAYAYDADKENRGPDGRTVPLWATWLGPPRPGQKTSTCGAPTIRSGGSSAPR
jgi:hypothetical protein